ncbi:MAG: TIGR00725 family protein [Myxococcales bacterium]|nr:TIGR00725 family protein [Myxococcales bacterium]
MHRPRRATVAVIGGADEPAGILAAAEALGAGVIAAGHRLITGGLGGVMEAACRGARRSPAWTEGSIVGVLPGIDPRAANPFVDVVITTGIGHLRNGIVVSSADVVVAIGGGAGTLSELALAWIHGRPIIALDVGWGARLGGARLDDRRDDAIRSVATVEAALAELARCVR